MKLSRYEQEVVINLNADEDEATVYTADRGLHQSAVLLLFGKKGVNNMQIIPISELRNANKVSKELFRN